jgi:FlaA1/EpsC-like NDP-sugar epimerase
LDVSTETLLGRRVVDIPTHEFADYLAGSSVLVTGAGGSLGRALCAQLTQLGVDTLVLVDQGEGSLVELAALLRDEHGFTGAVRAPADVRNAARVMEVFDQHRPDVVFHAAANKHVPLVEADPVEGVASNVLGTQHMVAGARSVGVQSFVLFSTDKAVQPTSVLGQTKAVAELIVAAAGTVGRYTAVRLGNVVDSAGSVLPLFRRQVARGGPLTVTHPQMTRYLMTASEAAGLAIVAGALADSTGIFWLDLGPPVPVLTLAQRLARSARSEVEIVFVGLRAGERLHEHMLWVDDEVEATPCVGVFRSALRHVDPCRLEDSIGALERCVERGSAAELRAELAALHRGPGGQVELAGASR